MGRRLAVPALAVAALALWAAGAVAALPAGKAPEPSVGVATASDGLEGGHPVDTPLLVEVILFNGTARSVAAHNARNRRFLERYRETEEYRGLSPAAQESVRKRFAPLEPPEYALGSAEAPLAGLVELRLGPTGEDAAVLSARPLAVTGDLPARIVLDGDESVVLTYGVAARTLAELEPGRHELRAVLDSADEAGMWQGRTTSPAVELRLTEAGPVDAAAAEARLFALGSYHLADRNFEELETVAERMLELDPRSVGGWNHMGDAQAGLGRTEDALAAFKRALAIYYEDSDPAAPGPLEHPEYTARRIRELEEERRQ